jgi:hypothetical protein
VLSSLQARAAGGASASSSSSLLLGGGSLAAARLDGAGNAPTADTLEQQLREAFLQLQLAAAAAEGMAWAVLDLAGLPRAVGAARLQQYWQE